MVPPPTAGEEWREGRLVPPIGDLSMNLVVFMNHKTLSAKHLLNGGAMTVGSQGSQMSRS